MAILQPIDAESQADSAAGIVAAQPDFSVPSEDAAANQLDDILGVADSIYVPVGQQENRWSGSEEFDSIARLLGRNDLCFGTAGPEGVTLETPFGTSSALIRLRADYRHPFLGSKLLSTLELPFRQPEEEMIETCSWLNFFESVSWPDVPQLGTWSPREIAEGQFHASSAWFIPNALFKPGLAFNVASWQLSRARWTKQQLWPDLQDSTMMKILEARRGLLPVDSDD
jgi:hypothetical protein